MGPIRHGGYGPPRESFVGLKWVEEMMMVVVMVVMVEDGGDDENGKNYDENNDWEKEKVGWTASRFYWHGDGDLMVVMNHNMMITMAKVWWEGS